MNATEFVKKFGIVRAKQILDHAPEGAASFDFIGIKYSNGSRLVGKKHIGLNHLKRLVESHELVIVWRMPESWRDDYDGDKLGFEGARMYLDMHGNHELVGEKLERFKQAIADVESCLEADKKLEGL
ncbi:hypothetical protein [Acinetobacter sp. TSRC1-2]|uniref:hypothetical protein n=1 Tax=unclassified Acinetobacter TaxID=196816 RepID=UPI003CEAA289